jgi:hypothetical protein
MAGLRQALSFLDIPALDRRRLIRFNHHRPIPWGGVQFQLGRDKSGDLMRLWTGIPILVFWALSAVGAPAQTCQLVQYGSVEMHVADGKVLLPLGIGGAQKDFELSLDAGNNFMTPALAEELKLQIHKLPPKIANSSQFAGAVTVPELRIGNVSLKTVEFVVATPEGTGQGLTNQVGLSMFGKVDLDIDMGAKKLNFFSQDHCPGKAVYWTKEFIQVPFELQGSGFIRPQLQLDGKPVIAALSLNYPSTIELGAMSKLFGVDEKSPLLTVTETTHDGDKVYRYPFKSLGTDELKVSNPAIRVVKGAGNPCKSEPASSPAEFAYQHNSDVRSTKRELCYGGADLTVGYSVLSKLHTYLSLKERVIYLSAADAH